MTTKEKEMCLYSLGFLKAIIGHSDECGEALYEDQAILFAAIELLRMSIATKEEKHSE